jgi:hypothetical protein
MPINSVSGPSAIASTAGAPTSVKSASTAQPPSQSATTGSVIDTKA